MFLLDLCKCLLDLAPFSLQLTHSRRYEGVGKKQKDEGDRETEKKNR